MIYRGIEALYRGIWNVYPRKSTRKEQIRRRKALREEPRTKYF
jgi:hypothetical protein